MFFVTENSSAKDHGILGKQKTAQKYTFIADTDDDDVILRVVLIFTCTLCYFFPTRLRLVVSYVSAPHGYKSTNFGWETNLLHTNNFRFMCGGGGELGIQTDGHHGHEPCNHAWFAKQAEHKHCVFQRSMMERKKTHILPNLYLI